MKRFRGRLVGLLGLIALFVSTSAAAQPAPEPLAELDRLLTELPGERSTPVALAKVQAISRLSEWVPRDAYAQRLDAAARAVRDPRVAFALHQKAAWAFAELKDRRYGADGFGGPLGQQGCLREWQVVGPFDNPSGDGFNTALGPELGEVGPYAGKLVEVDWRPLGAEDRYCEFNLNRAVQPSTAAVAYLAGELQSSARRSAVLLIGANGAYKVWLNGKLIAARDLDTGMAVDSDAWPIQLAPGANHLLVKLGSTQDGGLGLVARVVDPKLQPLPLPMKAQRKLTATAPGTPKMDGRSLRLEVEAAARNGRGDAAAWAAWLWRSTAWQNVSVPWRDVAENLLQSPDALSPHVHALTSELFEEYWRQVAIVQAAAQRDAQDPWVASRLGATLEQSLAEPDKLEARRIYERVAKTHPAFLPASIYLADWYKDHGFAERALKLLRAVEHPQRMRIPAYATRLVALEQEVGDLEASAALRQQAWQVTYLTSGYLWTEVTALLRLGKRAEAVAALDEYATFLPGSHYAQLRKANIYRAAGDFESALGVYAELQARAPGEPDLYEEQARLLLALGRADEALATYRVALQQRPQDQALRDFIAYLEPDRHRQFEPWLVQDPRAIAAEFPVSPFSSDTIVDNSVTFVSKNGLASTVFQRVDRILNQDGVESAKVHRGSYQQGDEVAEVLAVRVYKADGTISEDYDQWDSGGTRKASTTYNDTATITMRANDVAVGDLVEFRYRVSQVANENFRGDYFGDIAYLQSSRPIAFQRYAVVYPDNWELYFRAPRIAHERIDDRDPTGTTPPQGFRATSFEMRDVPLVEGDASQPGYADVYDYLLVSNKKTYDEIGKWWWNLVQEQLIVDEPIRQKVAELTRGLKSEKDRVAAIHNYVVKNTRYLHVGLGIHGWKPYRTSTCFRNRYGDCKDKAALLKVMLEEAGVKANLVLVRTRQLGTVDPAPASMHIFNHAITYVPSMDLYLDGTAEFNGTHELTTMDQGAQALIVEDGGRARLVTLPVDKSSANVMSMRLEVDLTGDEPVTRGKIVASGTNAVYFRQSLEDPERRAEALEQQLAEEFPGAKLVDASYKNIADLEKPTEVEFTMRGGQILRSDGQRDFVFPVGRPKSLLDAYAKRSKRTQDLDIRVPFTSETTIRYRLGAAKKFGAVPANSDKKSKFGSLSIRYDQDGDDLVVDVRYTIDVQRVSVDEYPEFRKFMADVTAALNDSIAVTEAR